MPWRDGAPAMPSVRAAPSATQMTKRRAWLPIAHRMSTAPDIRQVCALLTPKIKSAIRNHNRIKSQPRSQHMLPMPVRMRPGISCTIKPGWHEEAINAHKRRVPFSCTSLHIPATNRVLLFYRFVTPFFYSVKRDLHTCSAVLRA